MLLIENFKNRRINFIGDSGRVYERGVDEIMIGVVSKVTSRLHFVLVDYDDTSLDVIEKDFDRVKNKFRLPNGYIFRTSIDENGREHYSLVCFKLMFFKFYFELLCLLNCCVNFRYYTYKSRMGTLRITRKPDKKESGLVLVKVLKTKYHEEERLKKQFFRLVGFEQGDVND
jgi:hypothetical protein